MTLLENQARRGLVVLTLARLLAAVVVEPGCQDEAQRFVLADFFTRINWV